VVWAEILTGFLGLYAAVGVLFALAFVIFGAPRIDASAQGSGLAFRLLIFPGSAALWPLLFYRWRRGGHA
jgi:hypothetical protein